MHAFMHLGINSLTHSTDIPADSTADPAQAYHPFILQDNADGFIKPPS